MSDQSLDAPMPHFVGVYIPFTGSFDALADHDVKRSVEELHANAAVHLPANAKYEIRVAAPGPYGLSGRMEWISDSAWADWDDDKWTVPGPVTSITFDPTSPDKSHRRIGRFRVPSYGEQGSRANA